MQALRDLVTYPFHIPCNSPDLPGFMAWGPYKVICQVFWQENILQSNSGMIALFPYSGIILIQYVSLNYHPVICQTVYSILAIA